MIAEQLFSKYARAIASRKSRRTYAAEPLTEEQCRILSEKIDVYNREAQVHMQLMLNDGGAFEGFKRSYGLFKGVKNYIALVCPQDSISKERCGYYGERLILDAELLGLGTCWVGGTYSAKECAVHLNQKEHLYCVITVGVVKKRDMREKLIDTAIHAVKKRVVYTGDTMPPWFFDGIAAVEQAPSTRNTKPVQFTYTDGIVRAVVPHLDDYMPIDLGIAKLHFEIGAGGGEWQWGNNAAFTK